MVLNDNVAEGKTQIQLSIHLNLNLINVYSLHTNGIFKHRRTLGTFTLADTEADRSILPIHLGDSGRVH